RPERCLIALPSTFALASAVPFRREDVVGDTVPSVMKPDEQQEQPGNSPSQHGTSRTCANCNGLTIVRRLRARALGAGSRCRAGSSVISAVPTGLGFISVLFPALKRWAKFGGPSGASPVAESTSTTT